MEKLIASVLEITYWSGLPFAFGRDRFTKYKFEPMAMPGPLPSSMSADPDYLAADLASRLAAGTVSFRFLVQVRANDEGMPLDRGTMRWAEADSPPVHVGDLALPRQDVAALGQPEFGENLSMNIWRVTGEHAPQGSLAQARRGTYGAAADKQQQANGVPTIEPDAPIVWSGPGTAPVRAGLDRIVRAKIHPAIGVARVGDSPDGFFVGPEVTEPNSHPPGFYRDVSGALKRQAARFRLFGYDEAGVVVAELTAADADIAWTVHLANRKAAWYRFIAALDIPEMKDTAAPLRNPAVSGAARASLEIDPGPRTVLGRSAIGGSQCTFKGRLGTTSVELGEIRTDGDGRLLVLGGRGRSGSPSNAPVYRPDDPDSFNNADGWYDDVSDGPVTADLRIGGRSVPVSGAWVVVAPPNYAPDVVGWRTLHDLLTEVHVESGMLPRPAVTSAARDVLPVLRRLSNLQWVNGAFAEMFGAGGPMEFDNPRLVRRLLAKPAAGADPFRELRQLIFNAFRPDGIKLEEPRLWPWIYGDAFGTSATDSPRNGLSLSPLRAMHLKRWVDGDFIDDWDPAAEPPRVIEDVVPQDRPTMLDRAALHFCLGDAFHPGCEVTWPMRHASLYEEPYRIRHRAAGEAEPSYGEALTQKAALAPDGPLGAQSAGGLTRWMAVPWQGDTAFCRSGYEPDYDPYLPTFWPARVPNQVLTQENYELVMDETLPRERRLAAFHERAMWTRGLPGPVTEAMLRMVAVFGQMGVVESRPGPSGDPDFPETILVETLPVARAQALTEAARAMGPVPAGADTNLSRAGWESKEQLEEARGARTRRR